MASSIQFVNIHIPRREEKVGNQTVALVRNHSLDVELKGSVEQYHSFSQAVLRFLYSAEGIFRVGQLMQKGPEFINKARQEVFGMPECAALKSLSSKALTAWTWGTTYPRILCAASEANEAIKEAREALSSNAKELTSEQVNCKIAKAVQSSTDAASMMCYGVSMAAALVEGGESINQSFSSAASTIGFVHDVVSLGADVQNLNRAMDAAKQTNEGNITEEMHSTIQSTVWNNLLALAKDVCSVVSGVFGLILLATGASVVPGIALLALGLTGTILAVTRKIHEESLAWKPINFLDRKFIVMQAL